MESLQENLQIIKLDCSNWVHAILFRNCTGSMEGTAVSKKQTKVSNLDGRDRRIKHLLEENNRITPTPFVPTDDADKDKGVYKHQLDGRPKNFDQKVYMFPESFNALRRELSENWPTLWKGCQWFMANDALSFMEIMNETTGLHIQFDTEKVGWICDQYLVALRRLRGLNK